MIVPEPAAGPWWPPTSIPPTAKKSPVDWVSGREEMEDEVLVALVSGRGKKLAEDLFSRFGFRGPLVTVTVRLYCDGGSVMERMSPSSPPQKVSK